MGVMGEGRKPRALGCCHSTCSRSFITLWLTPTCVNRWSLRQIPEASFRTSPTAQPTQLWVPWNLGQPYTFFLTFIQDLGDLGKGRAGMQLARPALGEGSLTLLLAGVGAQW